MQRRSRKEKSVERKSEKPEEKKLPLKLYDKDWNVKVITREDLKVGTEGVCLTSDDHACEVIPYLSEQNLKLVLVTPGKINERSKKFDCRCFDLNQRITKVVRWYTNLGKVEAIPSHLQEGNDTPKVALTNTTVKIVVQIVKKYSSNKDWESATKNPGALIRDWIALANAAPHVVHTFRPIHKDKLQGGAQWIEQVIILKADGAKKLMRESGEKGVFTKRFMSGDDPPAINDWRIVWVGHDMSLKAVLERGLYLGDDFKGLAHGRNGLGVRVPQDSYGTCGKKLLGEDFVPSHDNSHMYEISKVPVWVSPGELIDELTTQMAWMTEFVRVTRSFGNVKSLLVRGSIAPPNDCIMLGDELVLIQPARPSSGGKDSVSYFDGKVANEDKKLKPRTFQNSSKGAMAAAVPEATASVDYIPKRRKSE